MALELLLQKDQLVEQLEGSCADLAARLEEAETQLQAAEERLRGASVRGEAAALQAQQVLTERDELKHRVHAQQEKYEAKLVRAWQCTFWNAWPVTEGLIDWEGIGCGEWRVHRAGASRGHRQRWSGERRSGGFKLRWACAEDLVVGLQPWCEKNTRQWCWSLQGRGRAHAHESYSQCP